MISMQPEKGINPLSFPLPEPFPKPARMSLHIPHLSGALKLLVDPQRDLKLLPRDDNETFGSDVVVNGDFHNFTMLDDANVLGHWIFDDVFHANELTGDALTVDQSGNGNDLTANNFSAGFADELTGSNPAYEGGNALLFNGVDQDFEIASAKAGDFDPGTGDFTIECWIYIDPSDMPSGNNYIIEKAYLKSGGNGWAVVWTGSNFKLSVSTELSTLGEVHASLAELNVSVAGYYHLAFLWDRDLEMQVWANGVKGDSLILSDATNITNLFRKLRIGSRDGSFYYDGLILSELRYSNKARTEQELKESYGVGKSWRTGSGAITPTNQSFAQRFTNSASSTGNMQQTVTTVVDTLYKLEFDGYRVSGSGNLTIELSGAHTKTLTYSNTANARQTYYFLATTTSLTIDVYGSNAGDVYQIDNVTVKPVSNAVQPANTTVNDRSSHGNNGTGQNSLEDDQPAHPASFIYNGIDQFVNFGDIFANDIESDVPKIIFVWLRTIQTGTFSEIFGKSQFFSPQPGMELKVDSSNRFAYYQINTWSSDAMYIATVATINDGNWHFLAIVDDGSMDGNSMKMFQNGVVTPHTTIIDTLSGSIVNSSNLNIGARDGGLQLFNGSVGILGMYLFTGSGEVRKRLPDGYKNIIKYIYDQTKDWYKS